MNMKTSLFASIVAVAHLCASAEVLYPVYTVTTSGDGIVTNRLEECEVSVVDSEGAEPRIVPFAQLDKSEGNFSGTFVINASSYLMGTVSMTNFTGEIRINSGALIVDAVGWLGVAETERAPKLYVEDGASLVPTSPVVRGGKIYNELHLKGAGYNGIGAFCSRYRAGHNDYCFYNNIYIDADATIGMWTGHRIDTHGAKCSIYLNGNTLTFKNFRSSGETIFCTYSSFIHFGTGNLFLDGVKLLVQDKRTGGWTFEPGGKITAHNRATFGFNKSGMNIPVPMVVDGNSFAIEGVGGMAKFSDATVITNRYQGPILLNKSMTVKNGGVALMGDVSGTGGIKVTSCLLQLGGTNTFSGAVNISGNSSSGIAFRHEKAVSPNMQYINITNAPLHAVSDELKCGTDTQYELPPLRYHVDEGYTYKLGANILLTNHVSAVISGGVNGQIASLRKTGAGELSILANYSITGRTEVLGGVLRLAPASQYSALPGLWEGVVTTNEEGKAEALEKNLKVAELDIYNVYKSTMCPSNRVVSDVYLFGKRKAPFWDTFMVTTYSGYLWNRTSEDVEVTLLGSILDAWMVYVNGRLVCSLYDGERLKKGTVTLKPGANRFEVRGWSWKRGDGGSFTPKNMPSWNPNMGFAMAYGVTDDNYDPKDYFVPANGPAACPGGDGVLFTRDARRPEEFTAEELSSTRATISNLCMTADGTINLSGSPLFVKTFEGVGNVVNGDLAIKEKWSLSYGTINSGGKLNIEGKLMFPEGAAIEFDHENVRPQNRPDGGFPIVSAAGGIEGTPTFVCDKTNWQLKVSEDRKSLCAIYRPTGTSIVIR